MNQTIFVLIIEKHSNDPSVLQIALNTLSKSGLEIKQRYVPNLKEAFISLSLEKYDVIIFDLNLHENGGLDTFLELHKHVDTIPIIIVGDQKNGEIAQKAISLGAQDYLPKPDLNADLLSRIIRYSIERQQLINNLQNFSFTDELTGLYNRRGFLTLLEQQLDLSSRTRRGFYFYIIDLDYLKAINDTYGHLVGDKALTDLAECLRMTFRRHDVIGRIGGDEFAILAINANKESGEYLKKNILDSILSHNNRSLNPFTLSVGIGKTYYDGSHKASPDDLFYQADQDLYKDKDLSHSKIN